MDHQLPSVGFRIFRTIFLCRLDLNDPPTAVGGISTFEATEDIDIRRTPS